MKSILSKVVLTNIVFLSMCVVLTSISCGAESPQDNNAYLGKLPGFYKKSEGVLTDLVNRYRNAKTKEEKKQIRAEKKEKKKEIKETFAKFNQSNPLKDTKLPFKVSGKLPFEVQSVTITKVSMNSVSFIIQVKINEDIKGSDGEISQRITVYFAAVDSNDEVISHTWNGATNWGWIKLTAGTIYDAKGWWNANRVQNMEDFAFLRIMSKDEYDQL